MNSGASFETSVVSARAALDRGDHAEAELRYSELAQRFPARAAGFVGLAQVAQARGDWSAAADAFETCLTRFMSFPELSRAQWRRARANCLRRGGRARDALEALRPVVEGDAATCEDHAAAAGIFADLGLWEDARSRWERVLAENRPASRPEWAWSHAQALIQLGRHDQAVERLRADVLADRANAYLIRRYFGLLGSFSYSPRLIEEAFDMVRDDVRIAVKLACAGLASRVNDIDRLQALIDEVLPRLFEVGDCERVFTLLPQAFEGWARTSRWLAIEQRLDGVAIVGAQAAEAAHVLRMRLKLALRDHPAFLRLQMTNTDRDAPRRQRFARLAEALNRRPFPDHDREKVFGVGLSKTGTTSLNDALGQLGYLSVHYVNDFTAEIFSFEDYFLFDAFTDTPACLFFETAFHMFPNSRFIYTTRPLDGWIKSMERQFERNLGEADFPALRSMATGGAKTRHGFYRATFAVPLFYRHANPREARMAFEARLFDFFSGERAKRLLVLDIFSGDGWPQLCAFLQREVPPRPFPRENVAVP